MGADNVDSLYENKREIALKNAQLRSEKNNIHWRSFIKTNSNSVRSFFYCNLINYISCGASCCREKNKLQTVEIE